MKLSTSNFHLELQPRRAVDDEDWVRLQVLLQVNGFRGDFEAWLQLNDLVRFRSEIEQMYEGVGQPAKATLASAEPDIDICLQSKRLGGISGIYRFESERLNGTPTMLSGAFEIDQSHLPGLERSVESLIWLLGGESTE